MSQLIKVIKTTQFSASQCLTVDVECQGTVVDLILLRNDKGIIQGYINKCPHTGVNLNWQPDQCFDVTNTYLICSLHGALFQPEDGLCIYGPCIGKSLSAVPVIVENEVVYLDTAQIVD